LQKRSHNHPPYVSFLRLNRKSRAVIDPQTCGWPFGPNQFALQQLPVFDMSRGALARFLLRGPIPERVFVDCFEVEGHLFDDLHLALGAESKRRKVLADVMSPIHHTGSGRFDLCDAVERSEKISPDLSLMVENLSTRRSKFVIPASALTGFLDPAASYPSARLQAVKQRVERSDMKLQSALGTLLDQTGDFVAVPGPFLHQSQNQHFGASPFDFLIEHINRLNIWRRHIYLSFLIAVNVSAPA
jgi:hypothetical protein